MLLLLFILSSATNLEQIKEWNLQGGGCTSPSGDTGTCHPGRELCGDSFQNAPTYHLMDQRRCAENDPNGPVFDPVHGVFHHFYQSHLAAPPGHGPIYGHFVSKDFIHWAQLDVAIWNGFDVANWKETPYDNEAIFTGSGVVVDGAGPNGQPGVVQIYPGLCNNKDWANCTTGTLLAVAVPGDYAGDELLVEWAKPDYNPIIEGTQRDPSSPWQTPSGEWRLRTYNSMVYGAASSADLLAGNWYTIGANPGFRQCECPSVYPLPAATPGFEDAYQKVADTLPTTVHKTSCGGDWWQMGTYTANGLKQLGNFTTTKGWEDLFAQRKIDQGHFYASKDNEYPTKDGGKRRINWGWARVGPASTQTLPREVTFNPITRQLQQLPIEELSALRGNPMDKSFDLNNSTEKLGINSMLSQFELIANFVLPTTNQTFGLRVGDPPKPTQVTRMEKGVDMPGNDIGCDSHPVGTDPSVCQAACDTDDTCQGWTFVSRDGHLDCCRKSKVVCPVPRDTCISGAKTPTSLLCGDDNLACEVAFFPPTSHDGYYEVAVNCGTLKETLRLLPTETTLEIRIFFDWTFAEVFFQQGRVAMTVDATLQDDSLDVQIYSDGKVSAKTISYPLESIWVSEKDVRAAPRVYKYNN